ncbi:MAG TPA: AAA domain-containing protein, partial [Candidatus Cybelea sp.]|nr:AAA domain-containing protein [Candidatus Cybelea sp.]
VRELRTARPAAETWVKMFDKAWYQSHLDNLFATDSALSTFKGSTHSGLVEEFKRQDHARLAESAARIRRSAAERYIKALNEKRSQSTVVSIELNKKIRQMSLRKLMACAPDVVTAIAPCIMASPLSVSQLLPAQTLFDFVIFDEASQVLPEDAIPTIIRGRNTIVAGDQRQLPPTTFFALTDRDEDDEGIEFDGEGMESILGLMCGFVEPRPLEWHYRSRDEALIAFSNEHIYDGRLLTFPGIGSAEAAVQHVYVAPSKVDGQEQSSSAEVSRVVELILEHAERRPDESLGVIAMGIKHARRIDEALQAERRQRPELDEFFAENRPESFFVKNLERVQGDERDVIILSIGYGPDRSGKMLYRFGPLNYDGGERRLNVAVTRAKSRVTVVSSFRSTDLDPIRLRASGAKLLGRYVQFAESKGANLGREGAVEEIAANDFEGDIAGALAAEGFELIPQYGVSNYRIDLAVKHPSEPGRFLLAIECDGATYHSSPTARDRDRLRQQHLEALGWRFHRIWSTDWFYNRSEEIARAKQVYQDALVGGPPKADKPTVSSGEKKPAETTMLRKLRRPRIQRGCPIGDYSDWQLVEIINWVNSDDVLRTEEEIIEEAARQMGYERKGRRIVEALENAVRHSRR